MMRHSEEHSLQFRTLLVLGRVSNLPTVWSNCLAGWLLSGAESSWNLALLCAATSCLYLGGMFLNDFCDESFDHEHRPERPIPRGLISRGAVLSIAALLFFLGLLLLLQIRIEAVNSGLILVAVIVTYDWLHKRSAFAVILMGACRSLLYILAATAAGGEVRLVFLPAAALGAYVMGLSLMARRESGHNAAQPQAFVFLFLPLTVAVWNPSAMRIIQIIASGLFLLTWIGWAVFPALRSAGAIVPAVGKLLAGIVLVDVFLVLSNTMAQWWVIPAFGALLGLTLLFQRHVPAT